MDAAPSVGSGGRWWYKISATDTLKWWWWQKNISLPVRMAGGVLIAIGALCILIGDGDK